MLDENVREIGTTLGTVFGKNTVFHVDDEHGKIGSDGDNASVNNGYIDTTNIGAEPAKRGRGRPRKNPDSGNQSATADHGSGASTAAGKSTAKSRAVDLDVNSIKSLLVILHDTLATIAKNDVWQLDEKEAAAIAQNAINVARHYPAAIKSQKIIDWGMLMQTLAVIYGGRLLAIKMGKTS